MATMPARKPRAAAKASVGNGARRVTMTDVAAEAGCSQTTVSFVLKNAPGVKISDETRQRVIETAIRLGYASTTFVHQTAVTVPGAMPVIGFIVDQLATSPEAVVAIDAARQASWHSGKILLSCQTMHDAEMEEKAVQTLLAHGMSELIYMTIFTRKIELPACLLNLSIPVVLLNCHSADHRLPAVIPAEAAGGHRATQYLIQNGHRRIGMITGEPWMEATRDRQKGYRRALTEAGIAFAPDLIVRGNWTASSGYEGTRRLLALHDRPTAIFCQNDRMAIGCYEALKETGLRIPQDISVIGYDDEEIARHLHPPLTTLILPHRAMGAWAIERLERDSGGGAARTRSGIPVARLDCMLIARDSVAKMTMTWA